MSSSLEIVVSPHHRARITVTRLLRADEIATVLRDLLACLSGEREPVVVADWGDMLVEAGARLDPQVDVQPLGAMAYRMLTGGEPPSPVIAVPGAPPPLARLISAMLAADPRVRPSLGVIKAELAALLGAQDELLDLAPPPLPRTRTPAPIPISRVTKPPPPPKDEELLDLGLPDDELLTLE